MALPQEPIEKFPGHIAAMRSFVNYIVTMMQTFPKVMTKLESKQRREIYEPCVVLWMSFVRELYGRPDLYADPPNPLPVDQQCFGAAMSDHVKERLGRNHPLFDFVNAPFTHPLGTQISLICINYSWDAYDTFVKELLGYLKTNCGSDPRIKALIERERLARIGEEGFASRLKDHCLILCAKVFRKTKRAANTALTTNQKLTLVGILPGDEEVAAAARQNYDLPSALKPQHVSLTF